MTPTRTTLAHELRNHAVEGGALVAEALLARAQRPEVLRGLRRDVSLQFHDDATDLSAADHHVEEDLGVGWINFEWRRVAALYRPCGQLGAGKCVAHLVLRRISRHEVCNVSALDRDELVGSRCDPQKA